jgi:hypothetical protein
MSRYYEQSLLTKFNYTNKVKRVCSKKKRAKAKPFARAINGGRNNLDRGNTSYQ